MGRKKLEQPSIEGLFSTISSMLVPAHVLEHFDIWDAHEYTERWVIEIREKAGRIPSELSSCSDVVFDGYTNPVETLSHSFVCKPIWLKLYRRRYKRANTDRHYSNDYDVSLKGVRMVPVKYVYDAVGEVRKLIVGELQGSLSKGRRRNEEDRKVLAQIEGLRRVSHAITQSPEKCNSEMVETIYHVFSVHEELKTAYRISQDFKRWYDISDRFKRSEKTTENLYQWYYRKSKKGYLKKPDALSLFQQYYRFRQHWKAYTDCGIYTRTDQAV